MRIVPDSYVGQPDLTHHKKPYSWIPMVWSGNNNELYDGLTIYAIPYYHGSKKPFTLIGFSYYMSSPTYTVDFSHMIWRNNTGFIACESWWGAEGGIINFNNNGGRFISRYYPGFVKIKYTGNYYFLPSSKEIGRTTDPFNMNSWVYYYNSVFGSLYSIVYGNKYIACSASGNVFSSTDLNNWTIETTGHTTPLAEIECLNLSGNFRYVVTMGNGNFLYSSGDGNWTLTPGANPDAITYNLAKGNNILVAVGAKFGNSSGVQTSTDGINWTRRFFNGYLPSSYNFFGIEYLNNTFVAVGENGMVQISSDGINWNQRDSNYTYASLYSAAYDGSLYYMGGEREVIITTTNFNSYNLESKMKFCIYETSPKHPSWPYKKIYELNNEIALPGDIGRYIVWLPSKVRLRGDKLYWLAFLFKFPKTLAAGSLIYPVKGIWVGEEVKNSSINYVYGKVNNFNFPTFFPSNANLGVECSDTLRGLAPHIEVYTGL